MGCGASTEALADEQPLPTYTPMSQRLLPRIKDNISVDELPDTMVDLHYGMPDHIKGASLRLLKIASVVTWRNLRVYEDIPSAACIETSYEASDELWDQTAMISWRWALRKPAKQEQGYSPMSSQQFATLIELLNYYALEHGLVYVWIDWCCMPQYSSYPGAMLAVLRSKAYYARARLMLAIPTTIPLPTGVVRLMLSKAGRLLKKRSHELEYCALGSEAVEVILSREVVSSRTYFQRVWPLVERMARHGRDEHLCNWLSLEAWLGMVISAILNNKEDKSADHVFRKLLGKELGELLDKISGPLAKAIEAGSLMVVEQEGLEQMTAQVLEQATNMWQSMNILQDGPTKAWLLSYLEDTQKGTYSTSVRNDHIWAVFSFYSWKKVNFDCKAGLVEALQDLVRVAGANRQYRQSLAKTLDVLDALPLDPQDHALSVACDDGDLERVKELLNSGANVLQTNQKDGQTLLHSAVSRGYVEIARTLLLSGVDVNSVQEEVGTALDIAVETGNLEMVNLLVKAKVDKEVYSSLHGTPLYKAVIKGNHEIVKVLTAAGANLEVTAKARPGYTPLLTYVENGDCDMVKVLLDAGANVEATREEGLPALHVAVKARRLDIVKLLLDAKADTAKTSKKEGFTALHWAVQGKNHDMVKLLLEAKVQTEVTDKSGRTALFMAAEADDLETVELLLKGNASPNVTAETPTSGCQYSPLHLFAERGNTAAVQIMLGANADVYQMTGKKNSALELAIKGKHTGVVKALLEAKCDVKARPKDVADGQQQSRNRREGTDPRTTPLHLAISTNQPDVVEMLLDAGADTEARDEGLFTPLCLAAKTGYANIVSLLIKAKAKLDVAVDKEPYFNPLLYAATNGHREVVKLLLEAGALKDFALKDGATALYLAVEHNHPDIVKDLCGAGLKLDAALSKSGTTALIFASEKGYLDVVKILIAAGASVAAARRLGYQPIHAAATGDNVEVLRVLIEAGVNLDVPIEDGSTPLYLAAEKGNASAVKYLLEAGADKNKADNNGRKPKDVAKSNVSGYLE